ncbi:MAG: hypothetical protein K0S33_2304 [Bacteroidetes bacterium]|jgi:uncharacterized protein (DUF58 family)|nr:hypothetical protein [Bacteroidota bacterium]
MSIFHEQRIRQFSGLELLAKQVVEGFITGLHKSPFHGFSVEFAEHRLYNKGESTRHMDWKLFARSDKLFVKRYEEETNLRCQIVIDSSSSMYFPFLEGTDLKDQENKIVFSIKCAAALIELLKKQRDAVGLSIFDNEVKTHFNARSSTVHHKMLYSELEKLLEHHQPENRRDTNIAEALHQIAETIHKRSLVVLFSDMFETGTDTEYLFSALQHLRHKKHEVVLFHVTDKQKEIDFDFENRPYRFVDMETGQELKVNPTDVRQQYLTKMAAFYEDLKLKCAQYRIDLIEANINEGFDTILKAYLAKRGNMM